MFAREQHDSEVGLPGEDAPGAADAGQYTTQSHAGSLALSDSAETGGLRRGSDSGPGETELGRRRRPRWMVIFTAGHRRGDGPAVDTGGEEPEDERSSCAAGRTATAGILAATHARGDVDALPPAWEMTASAHRALTRRAPLEAWRP